MSSFFVGSRTLPSSITFYLAEYAYQEIMLGNTIECGNDLGGDIAFREGINCGLIHAGRPQLIKPTNWNPDFEEVLSNFDTVFCYSNDGAEEPNEVSAASGKIGQLITANEKYGKQIINLGKDKNAFKRLVGERRLQVYGMTGYQSFAAIESLLATRIPSNCTVHTGDPAEVINENALVLIPKDAGMAAQSGVDIDAIRKVIARVDMLDNENKAFYGEGRVGSNYLKRHEGADVLLSYVVKSSWKGTKFFCNYSTIQKALKNSIKESKTTVMPRTCSGLYHACWFSLIKIIEAYQRPVTLICQSVPDARIIRLRS